MWIAANNELTAKENTREKRIIVKNNTRHDITVEERVIDRENL